MKKKEPRNKCQICLFEGFAHEFGDDEDTCPICGSNDIDDITYNAYNEDAGSGEYSEDDDD